MLPKKGTREEEIIDELEKRLNVDLTFNSGKILCSMCTYPHSLAQKIVCRYMDRNLGDPGLHKGSREIEKEAVQMLFKFLQRNRASERPPSDTPSQGFYRVPPPSEGKL